MGQPPSSPDEAPSPDGGGDGPRVADRVKEIVLGKPKTVRDASVFHRISLVAFLAWVGLGADGLSSSAYGPDQAFRALGEHRYLAVALAVAMAGTVFLISAAYARIIERFPTGGGGYVVTTKLLGEKAGLVSGCALLVDYVLTTTVSVAAAGDAMFSFLPQEWAAAKLPAEMILLLGLTTLNLRGVRESVIVLTPIFLVFLMTHAVLIVGGIVAHAPQAGEVATEVTSGFETGAATLGLGAMALLLFRAYSLGGGTYTGIEAVSNGLAIMREPRVQTAKRTMLLMAVSLALTASGLMVCFLLWDVSPVPGKTMNAVLVERFSREIPLGPVFVVVTLASEAMLLVVAAQAGFLAGPRVLASMAVDSWVPRRFAALSERLTTQNGIVLLGLAAMAALVYTEGDVDHLVVMYSINVFLTFALSLFGMTLLTWKRRSRTPRWHGSLALFGTGFVVCLGILAVTVGEKFLEGGWMTLLVTGALVALCLLIRRHYRSVVEQMRRLYETLESLPTNPPAQVPALDRTKPAACVLVARYGGVGIHTVLNVLKTFPGQFRNLVFVSVGVVDSGSFKGEEEIAALQRQTEQALRRYVDLANRLGMAAEYRTTVGTDVVEEAANLCLQVARDYPRTVFFASKVILRKQRWYERILHNETAIAIQRRLQMAGLTMVNFPARVE